MASKYTDEQSQAIRGAFQAAIQMVSNADGKGKLREFSMFSKGVAAVLPKDLWKLYLGDLKPALVLDTEYDDVIRNAFVILDQVDPSDGYVMRFALLYGLQQAAGIVDGAVPAERYALDRVKWLVGAPVHAYAPPGFVPPPIM